MELLWSRQEGGNDFTKCILKHDSLFEAFFWDCEYNSTTFNCISILLMVQKSGINSPVEVVW